MNDALEDTKEGLLPSFEYSTLKSGGYIDDFSPASEAGRDSLRLESPGDGTTAETAPRTARAAFFAVDFPALATRLTSPRRVDRAVFLAGRLAAFRLVRPTEPDLAPLFALALLPRLAADLLARLAEALVAPRAADCFVVAFRAADFLFDLAISFCSFDPPNNQGLPGIDHTRLSQASDGS